MIVGKARKFLISSNAYRKNEAPLLLQMNTKRNEFLELVKDKEKPLEVRFLIYRKSARRFDYGNILQGFLDCMVKAGWIPDDNANEIIPIYMPYAIDRDNPRVELWV